MQGNARSHPVLGGGSILVCVLMALLLTAVAGDRPAPDQVVAVVAGNAGAPAAGGGLRINGTVGQPTPIGRAEGTDRVLHAGFWGVRQGILTGVETQDLPPLRTDLVGNSPNPFNPATRIRFTLAAAGPVRLEIFNARGAHVRTLVDELRPAGRHDVIWRGDDAAGRRVASGVYFYRLRADGYQAVKKMLMLK